MKQFNKLVVLDKVDFFDDQEDQLRKLAKEVKIYNNTPKDDAEIAQRVGNADAIITSWTELDKEDIKERLKNIKYIGVSASAYSWIDVKQAKKQGITVANVPGYAVESVAELFFGQLISMLRKTHKADSLSRAGKFERTGLMGEELQNKTIGIIGLGRIGRRVAEIARAFNMNILYYNRRIKPEFEGSPIKYCKLNELLKKSDIVAVHISGAPPLIGEKELALLKNGAIISNLAAGGVISEQALAKELRNGRIRAIIDTYEMHKIKKDLQEAENVTLLTPEIGFYTKQAVKRLTRICINNAKSYLEGNPQNVI
jgi:lactate dehydrogenase-like 2-hydroxyacid dehydrogenase